MRNTHVNIFWFRRDLRLEDNAGLYHALKGNKPVVPVFIFDRNILDKLENKKDRRVTFIYEWVNKLRQQLIQVGSALEIFYGFPEVIFPELLEKYKVDTIFANHDYEPYALERDNRIKEIAADAGADFFTFKDHVIFEKDEIIKQDGSPYTVFTPYSRRWKERLTQEQLSLTRQENCWRIFISNACKLLFLLV